MALGWRFRTACLVAVTGATIGLVSVPGATAGPAGPPGRGHATAPGIRHIVVVDFENESFETTFGPTSPATYLNSTLVPQGELLSNYFAIGHVSMDNYIAQISGQAPNEITSNDCSKVTQAGFTSTFDDVVPGTFDSDQRRYPGQVDGQGCVYPKAVQTIGDQLQSTYPRLRPAQQWREYAEDMGNDPARDLGVADPLGGTDCAHPAQAGGTAADPTGLAQGPNATGAQQVKSDIADQYADRHNPFIYFHSVIDHPAACAAHVVPLGTVTVGTAGQPDQFHGHLARDLARESTTPKFSFITPNLCNDAHDATCAGTNTEGGTTGGLVGADLWLKHWMPLLLSSPAYRDGSMLVVVTFDEGAIADFRTGDNEQPGPGSSNPGYSSLLNIPIPAYGGQTYYQLLHVFGLTPGVAPPPGTMPGGGRIGALLLNSRWIAPGSTNMTSYNHYSALRTFEDLLGIHKGGADRRGHLGFASTATSFGSDVFHRHPRR
jgi:phosphatidylinositol-3-phosphatase